ncbi:hypothetical protein B1207_07820 [Legionella quinlivanii]|uniref:Uncharacterized protein n=1 Tax=Legionella quinlivanii TaxID=45073 RepID=A0A364LJL1_9GAMM|nr:hypothetical protein [Legionella quinlivanii]RAP36698.1 hypothetical protein B1207_07820 [Legionella quinlivanii]
MAIATTSTFFRQAPGITSLVRPVIQSADKQQAGYIYVGEENDCFFRSAAAAIISKALDNPAKHEGLIQQILEYHKPLFPKPQQLERADSYVKRLRQLMAQQPITQFVRDLGFTLRQITVDELVSDPVAYQDAFSEPLSSVAEMRQSDTRINDNVVRDALAKRLSLSIKILEVEPGKEFHATHHSSPPEGVTPAAKLKLQVEDKLYRPHVANIAVFEKYNAAMALPELPEVSRANEPSMDELKAQIKESRQLLRQDYLRRAKNLEVQYNAKGFDKTGLRETLLEEWKYSFNYHLRVPYAGIEHGVQKFFRRNIGLANKHEAINSKPQRDYQEHTALDFIHAIAQGLSLGIFNEDRVFANLEKYSSKNKKQEPSPGMRMR